MILYFAHRYPKFNKFSIQLKRSWFIRFTHLILLPGTFTAWALFLYNLRFLLKIFAVIEIPKFCNNGIYEPSKTACTVAERIPEFRRCLALRCNQGKLLLKSFRLHYRIESFQDLQLQFSSC